MTTEKTDILKSTNALLTGHFRLTSGLHSSTYFQCAKILTYPDITEKICAEIAVGFKDAGIAKVIAPAIGGIVVGYEMAKALKAKSVFAERENGVMTLRRGFQIEPGERILIAEDVITTGGSVLEVRDIVEKMGGAPVGFASLIDRSGGKFNPGIPYVSWFQMEVKNYNPDDCPMCKEGIPVVKPGSRVFAE